MSPLIILVVGSVATVVLAVYGYAHRTPSEVERPDSQPPPLPMPVIIPAARDNLED